MSRHLTFPLDGGLDISTPVSRLKPGNAWIAINFELAPSGGYRRVAGYERFDGRPAPSDTNDLAQRELRRAAITTVPGSGPVRGVFVLKGVVYAFRNNAGNTAKNLYKSTATGWQLVSTPTLAPGGRGEYVLNNFYGSPNGLAVYGVDGVNKAFQFDGTTYTEITTGSEPLYPKHVAEFREHLFLSYDGGSLQNSATGNPLDWTAVNGAGELAMGDEIRAIYELQGGVLGIFCKDRIKILQGTSVDNFILQAFSDTGATEWSVQPLFSDAVFLDKQIQRMGTTNTFGDFQANSLSEPIRPLIESSLNNIQFAYTVPKKNQYVLFTSGGTGFVASFKGNQLAGFTLLTTGKTFFVGGSFEDVQGTPITLCGGNDGYVYMMDKGTSFDGNMIQAFLQLCPWHMGDFQIRKRFRKVTVETDSTAYEGLFVTADFDYASQPRAVQSMLDSMGTGLSWNLGNWNEAIWNGSLKNYAEAYIDGHGRNISVYLYHQSAFDAPFTLELMTIAFDLRKPIR